MYRCLLIAFLLMYTVAIQAQDSTESVFSGIGIYVDQDALYPNRNEDRDYSFGQGIALGGKWIDNKWNPFKYLLNASNFVPAKALNVYDSKRTFHYMTVSLKAYTPDSLNTVEIIDFDRPFANVFFVNFGKRSVHQNNKFYLNTDVRIGLLGTPVAREIQSFFHSAERERRGSDRPVNPQGWENQISNGGELTGMLRWQLAYLSPEQKCSFAKCKSRLFQYMPKVELSLGYQTYAAASLDLLFGKIESPLWAHGSDCMEYGNVFYRPKKKWFEMYVFAKGTFQYMFYDALLQGQFKESVYTLSSDQIQRPVAFLEVGGMMRIKYFKTWVSFNHRTSNFTLQNRNHYWVSMGINFVLK